MMKKIDKKFDFFKKVMYTWIESKKGGGNE